MERIALTPSPDIQFSSLLYHLHIQAMCTISHLGPFLDASLRHLNMPRRKRRSDSVPPADTYLTIHLDPPTTDELVLMKSIHDSMQQSFGLTRALTYFDVAYKDADGTRIVIRVGEE